MRLAVPRRPVPDSGIVCTLESRLPGALPTPPPLPVPLRHKLCSHEGQDHLHLHIAAKKVSSYYNSLLYTVISCIFWHTFLAVYQVGKFYENQYVTDFFVKCYWINIHKYKDSRRFHRGVNQRLLPSTI